MLSADATAAVSEDALKMDPTSENTDPTGLSGLLSPAAGPALSLDFDVSSRSRCSLFKYKTDLLMMPRAEQLSITAVVTGTPLTNVILVYYLILYSFTTKIYTATYNVQATKLLLTSAMVND